MKSVLKMNLDSGEWFEIPFHEVRYDTKRYYQSNGFEQDYYTHAIRLQKYGWSFFTPVPRKENPRLSFLFWDSEKIDISYLPKYTTMSPHMNDEKLSILNSYLRDRKIETIIK
jgi:hypothetical protein